MSTQFNELYTIEKKDIICNFAITEAFIDGIKKSENYHFHSRYELYAVKSGRMRIIAEHREYLLCEGDIAIVPPGTVHYVYEDADSVRTGFLFDFAPSKNGADGAFYKAFKNAFEPICDITHLNCPQLYERYLSFAIRTVADGEPRYATEELLFLTVDHARRHLGGVQTAEHVQTKPSNGLLAVRIENYMNRSYNGIPDIAELAHTLGYSVRQTQRILGRLYGMSFSQLINKKRIAVACFMLRGTDRSLEKVALQTGFCSQSHLCRAFRKALGTTPLAYRNAK